ncbi:DNA-binding transcriptional LysR family regulator [Aliiruegeria haliotis]|uniref:DNA-binding transcriptional LysR family regulator n=1 Tax=Aliiruegeria haliotis TaxID=1280846 RepID=A0A2T0S0A2_9RHOB|nr:LysR family transcriptional regulator [Aliiruegeria haliotis]PRY26854.1 DNA-binding transcriptional LysR family regulator [Aliiruegeria haliotis]
MDKWTELRTAYSVAKLGTVSAAAEALGYHRATVNRHIDLLEETLGAPIFIRHARGYALTDLGEDMLQVAQKTEELTNDLANRARSGDAGLEGEIRVTALPVFLRILMGPIERFRQDNPRCRVSILASSELARLEHGDAHVALRVGERPDHPDYVVTPFGSTTTNLYAQESYIARRGMPAGAHDLDGHEFVVLQGLPQRLPFARWFTERVSQSQIAVSSAHPQAVTEAVKAGLGLGFLGEIDAERRPDLHPVLPPEEAWASQLWLVTHVDLHRTEKVQAMLKCLREVRCPDP